MEYKRKLYEETEILLNKIIENEIKILNEEYIKLLEENKIENNILNSLKLYKYESRNGRYENQKYSYVNFYFTDDDKINTLKIKCKENLEDSSFQYNREVLINGEKIDYWSSDSAYNCGYYSPVYKKYNIVENNIVSDISSIIYNKWNELDMEFIDLVNTKISNNNNSTYDLDKEE
jgi:hypothetical protein